MYRPRLSTRVDNKGGTHLIWIVSVNVTRICATVILIDTTFVVGEVKLINSLHAAKISPQRLPKVPARRVLIYRSSDNHDDIHNFVGVYGYTSYPLN